MRSSFLNNLSRRFSSGRKGWREDASDINKEQCEDMKEVVTVSGGTLRVRHCFPSDLDFDTIPISDGGTCCHSFDSSRNRSTKHVCTCDRKGQNSMTHTDCKTKVSKNCCTSTCDRFSGLRNVAYICGKDAQGWPIVVVDATEIPTCSCMRSEALLYITKKLDPVADAGHYNLIFVMSPNSEMGKDSRMATAYMVVPQSL
ncbi:hypothetical protein KP509_02G017400 [Ceratopteris richardii]|uniref:Uncharacterized protein n=1 Tax=Ceratopteris richardii TaxID=49495 RepID=A0A8T2V6Q2_CERRI|nr:hypothetical protein KP509_02G017400 [Ceratopteris richardii]